MSVLQWRKHNPPLCTGIGGQKPGFVAQTTPNNRNNNASFIVVYLFEGFWGCNLYSWFAILWLMAFCCICYGRRQHEFIRNVQFVVFLIVATWFIFKYAKDFFHIFFNHVKKNTKMFCELFYLHQKTHLYKVFTFTGWRVSWNGNSDCPMTSRKNCNRAKFKLLLHNKMARNIHCLNYSYKIHSLYLTILKIFQENN